MPRILRDGLPFDVPKSAPSYRALREALCCPADKVPAVYLGADGWGLFENPEDPGQTTRAWEFEDGQDFQLVDRQPERLATVVSASFARDFPFRDLKDEQLDRLASEPGHAWSRPGPIDPEPNNDPGAEDIPDSFGHEKWK